MRAKYIILIITLDIAYKESKVNNIEKNNKNKVEHFETGSLLKNKNTQPQVNFPGCYLKNQRLQMFVILVTQPGCTCLKPTMKTQEKYIKCFQN